MDNYPRLFIKAGLIYALLGAALGVTIAIDPSLAVRLRFVHIHINLLGFMAMMVAGVAFHVLPRFSARKLPWPEGMKYQFILQNTGLLGMVTLHAFGGWQGGVAHAVFVFFAILAGIAFAIMFYNLYFVLTALEETPKPEKITGEMKVAEVLDHFPQALSLFLESGFQSLANPAARQTFAKVVSIEKACEKHGVNATEFIEKLNREIFKTNAPSKDENTNPGREISRGEKCQADTWVGSLVKTYPTTKKVFESHYGEGCFSCPGQAFETVEQTASMHNVDPELILAEINNEIEKELKPS
jgi:hybrid cluster-associated redox disulfide protein